MFLIAGQPVPISSTYYDSRISYIMKAKQLDFINDY